MKRFAKRAILALLAAAVIAGCGGGGGGSDDHSSSDLSAFVHDEIASTSETSEPSSLPPTFSASEDEHQFDDLFR